MGMWASWSWRGVVWGIFCSACLCRSHVLGNNMLGATCNSCDDCLLTLRCAPRHFTGRGILRGPKASLTSVTDCIPTRCCACWLAQSLARTVAFKKSRLFFRFAVKSASPNAVLRPFVLSFCLLCSRSRVRAPQKRVSTQGASGLLRSLARDSLPPPRPGWV